MKKRIKPDPYGKDELLQAALFAIRPDVFSWPQGWGEHFENKIRLKDKINRLRVAGAFIAAAIDREHYLLSKDQNPEVSDATTDDSSNEA